MWIFTPQESKAILFILVVLSAGAGVLNYKNHNPDFAPELLEGDSKAARAGLQMIQSSILPKDTANQTVNPEVQSERPNLKVNLNTASLEELERLPQVGPVLAKRIVDYRYQKGGFNSIEEITKVKGIGKKTYQAIKEYLFLN
jgi:comEA protein